MSATSYDWFKVIKESDFLDTGLVSKKISAYLEGYGQKDILVTRGNSVGICYADTFLMVEFDENNPYVRDGYAVYKDEDGYLWLGIEVVA